jgi:hypothetical protein
MLQAPPQQWKGFYRTFEETVYSNLVLREGCDEGTRTSG